MPPVFRGLLPICRLRIHQFREAVLLGAFSRVIDRAPRLEDVLLDDHELVVEADEAVVLLIELLGLQVGARPKLKDLGVGEAEELVRRRVESNRKTV